MAGMNIYNDSRIIDKEESRVYHLGAGVLKCFVVKFCRHQGRVMSYV